MRDQVLDIVRRYVDDRVKYTGDGNISVRCPFHKGGQEKHPSFSVHLDLGLYNCFTCHASGTIPRLLTNLGVPYHQVDAETGGLRDHIRANLQLRQMRREGERQFRDPFQAPAILSESLITMYEWCPTPLVQAGFHWKVLQDYQIGVDLRNQRITYPIRDIYGNLAGFVGGRTQAGQQPKYKVYQGTQTEPVTGFVIRGDYGEWFDEEYPGYTVQKSDYLWNLDRIYPRLFFDTDTHTVIIVEGFKAALWLIQNGYQNVVALMGSYLSDKQSQLLMRLNAKVRIFLDNNEPGQRATYFVGRILQPAFQDLAVVTYPPGADAESQPDDLDYDTLRYCIENPTPYVRWRKNVPYRPKNRERKPV